MVADTVVTIMAVTEAVTDGIGDGDTTGAPCSSSISGIILK
jgi:hypothetical protein